MKKVTLRIKKLTARAMVALGAALGLSGCLHRIGHNPAECVYGPPPGWDSTDIQVVEDVYGPPVDLDSITENEVIEPDSLSEPGINRQGR